MGKEEISAKPGDGSVPEKAVKAAERVNRDYDSYHRLRRATVRGLMLMGGMVMLVALLVVAPVATMDLRRGWRNDVFALVVGVSVFVWGACYVLWATLIKREVVWAAKVALVMVGINGALGTWGGVAWLMWWWPQYSEDWIMLVLLVLVLLGIGALMVELWRVVRWQII